MTVTRFAPSPTGHLHLGHAYSALFAAHAAEEAGGRFLLRIEDIDPVRCRPEFTEDLMEDLRWLRLRWEEPVRRQSEHMADYDAALDALRAKGLLYPCFCTRKEIEAEAAAAAHAPHLGSRPDYKAEFCLHRILKWKEKARRRCGASASGFDAAVRNPVQTRRALRKCTLDVSKKLDRSPCYALRFLLSQITFSLAQNPFYNRVWTLKAGPDGPVYPGTCRGMSAAEREDKMAGGLLPVWRLDVAKACKEAGALAWRDRLKGKVAARPEAFGDVVLARKDVPASYHLCVTVDDHLQGVTLVTRGEDLFRATDVHRLLQALLGYETPEYHHHGLLMNDEGKRFAKRDKAATLRALRESGRTAEEARRMAGF